MCMRVFMRKIIQGFFLDLVHFLPVFIGAAGFLQDMLDLGDRDHREEFRKQEITGKEQSERPEIESDLPDRWAIIGRPATGDVVAVNREDDDDEALEPHPDIHDDRHKERNRDVPAHLPEPEDLR